MELALMSAFNPNRFGGLNLRCPLGRNVTLLGNLLPIHLKSHQLSSMRLKCMTCCAIVGILNAREQELLVGHGGHDFDEFRNACGVVQAQRDRDWLSGNWKA